mmetsp:Transcript_21614/g.30281  ORF Transcript_21614/g.30281 Transcript_21614/m.30281 type:complete len:424 (+) Transcript_21614:189-1460(+)
MGEDNFLSETQSTESLSLSSSDSTISEFFQNLNDSNSFKLRDLLESIELPSDNHVSFIAEQEIIKKISMGVGDLGPYADSQLHADLVECYSNMAQAFLRCRIRSSSFPCGRSVEVGDNFSRSQYDETKVSEEENKEELEEESIRDQDCGSQHTSTSASIVSIDSSIVTLTFEQQAIRQHAHSILCWAEKATKKKDSDSKSLAVSSPSRIKDIVIRNKRQPRFSLDTNKDPPNNINKIIREPGWNFNIYDVKHKRGCPRAKLSQFGTHNPEDSEFFLPNLGISCNCGAELKIDPNLDPTCVRCFLRPWQADFLQSIYITHADQLIQLYKMKPDDLAKSMSSWRKKMHLPRTQTKSCYIAMHIWAKTAKTIIARHPKSSIEKEHKIFKEASLLEMKFLKDNSSLTESTDTSMHFTSVLTDGESEI